MLSADILKLINYNDSNEEIDTQGHGKTQPKRAQGMVADNV